MGGPFLKSQLEPIRSFISDWNNAEHEFFDVDTEYARQELFRACDTWFGTVIRETYYVKNASDYQSVPSEWEEDFPDRFINAVSQLHAQGQQIVDMHQRLVRVGTRRLLP
jgi:hypothetical protein